MVINVNNNFIMGFIDEKDTITKGYFKPSNMENDKEYVLTVIDYKREKGGKFADLKDGYSTIYTFSAKYDPYVLSTFADDNGRVIMLCNSKRLRQAFFEGDINIGETIGLTKSGKGFDTDYTVRRIKVSDEKGKSSSLEEAL